MKRPLYLLSGILIVQVIIYGLLQINPHRVKEPKPFLTLDTSQVSYIKVKNEYGEVVLKRIGGQWKLTEPVEFAANQSYVKTLLEKLASLREESFITRDKDAYSKYELNDTSAIYVEIGKEGKPIDKFWCGKPSETYTHTYMRREGSSEVWLVSGTPRTSLLRKPKEWRDKTALTLDRSRIEKVILRYPDKFFELKRILPSERQALGAESGAMLDTTRIDTTWMVYPPVGKPFTPEKDVLNRLLSTISKLPGSDVLDQGIDTIPDLSRVEFSVEVQLEGDIRHKVEFIPKPDDDTRWLARVDGNNKHIFVTYRYNVKNLMRSQEELASGEKYENPQDQPPKTKKKTPGKQA